MPEDQPPKAPARTAIAARPPHGPGQHETYLHGLFGVVPTMPMSSAELEARARAALPPSLLSYVAGGAGEEIRPDGQPMVLR
ncbi:hypothetical protein AB0A71_38835 [Kitasatospora aureofaciens]|uniref:hypothetical protein n=1 Tax=Kitasatospora aureofaciens TaxID=1894 RepID=UPI0033CC3770